jgi:hypothetical protein
VEGCAVGLYFGFDGVDGVGEELGDEGGEGGGDCGGDDEPSVLLLCIFLGV